MSRNNRKHSNIHEHQFYGDVHTVAPCHPNHNNGNMAKTEMLPDQTRNDVRREEREKP